MFKVKASNLKTNLSERILFTKYGIPVAILAPVGPKTDPQKAMAELKSFRQEKF